MVNLRLARASDPAAIARAQVAAWHAAYVGLIPDAFLAEYTVAQRTQRWEQILRAPLPGGVTLVGEVDGAVEGFASIAHARGEEDDGGELVALYVHPGRWETGLGHALHEAALEHLVAAGHARAVLWVLEGNARARSFYERHGWGLDGRRKIDDYAGVGVPGVRLARGLGG